MKTFAAGLLLLAALLVSGCKGGGEAAVIGKWKGEIKMPENQKDDPAAKFAEAFASMLNMDLEMKEDHTYKMVVMIISMEGNWSMSGNTVTLTPKTIMGLTPEEFKKEQEKKNPNAVTLSKNEDMVKPMTLTLAGDGKSMTASDPSGKGNLVFSKKS